MTVSVITDGGSGLSPAAAAALGLHVVPMYVTIGEREVRDHELTLDDVRSATTVTTATPSPGDFRAAIEQAGPPAVVITVSSQLSANMSSASGAGMAMGNVHFVDSGSAGGGEILVATAALGAANDGLDVHAVARRAEEVAAQVRVMATLGSLDWLARSGRVPQVAAWAGRQLHVRPLFSLQQGRVVRHRPALGRESAADRIVHSCTTGGGAGKRLHFVAMHGEDASAGTRLFERVMGGGVDVAESHVCPFSVGMMVHSGPDLSGLAWWWEKD